MNEPAPRGIVPIGLLSGPTQSRLNRAANGASGEHHQNASVGNQVGIEFCRRGIDSALLPLPAISGVLLRLDIEAQILATLTFDLCALFARCQRFANVPCIGLTVLSVGQR